MASWLVIPAILLAVFGLGSALVLQFIPLQAWRNLYGVFASITLGVLSGGWLGLILAESNVFSTITLLTLWVVVFLLLLMLAFVRRERTLRRYYRAVQNDSEVPREPAEREWIYLLVLVLWLIVATWLFFRPHEYIQGGADAGVYVSLGAEIAQNGGFVIQDQTLAALNPALQEIFLRPLTTNPVAASYLFPGFYVTDAALGSVVPQFYSLHPVWQAIAFSLSSSVVEGAKTELLIAGLWMMLASVAIILTAKELGGWPAALLMMGALSLAALQVWFARYPTTEALTQFLLWSGLWGMLRWLGGMKSASLWAFLSGAALGAVFLVRIDILVLLPMFVMFGVGLWLRGWQSNNWWFVVPFTLMVAHSFFHGAVYSAPYFSEHIGYGLRLLWANWWMLVLGAAICLLGLWLLSAHRENYEILSRYRLQLSLLLIGGFLLYALYGWFIRPAMLTPTFRPDPYSETVLLITNHENWRRLGWYLSAVGIWIGVAGICLLIWRIEFKTAVLVATGVLFSIIYLWNVQANPHQIYVMRRYVPAVAPFFLLAGAYLISQLPGSLADVAPGLFGHHRTGMFIAGSLAMIWLALLGWSARGFVSQVDNYGVLEQLAAIDEDLPDNSILLFNDQSPVGLGDFWGTPLKYIFGHDAYSLRDIEDLDDVHLAEAIEFWQNNGRSVIWIGDPQWLTGQGFEYHETQYTISSSVLESSYEHKPWQIIHVDWELPAALLDSNPQT